MPELLKIIQSRQSTRGPFDPEHPVSKKDLQKILEAGRWTPSAHNMQNFEILVVDDKKLLKAISGIKVIFSEAFIRENFQQLSFSEEELQKKKVGLLGTWFPPELRNPEAKMNDAANEKLAAGQIRLIQTSPVLLMVIFDPAKRAPDSEGDFLGTMSLGCMLENMWLMAHSLGIGFHVVSDITNPPTNQEIKKLLNIPPNLKLALSVRLGYPVGKGNYLRVRRDIADFTHHNRYENKGIE
jgi:nitroreductase